MTVEKETITLAESVLLQTWRDLRSWEEIAQRHGWAKMSAAKARLRFERAKRLYLEAIDG